MKILFKISLVLCLFFTVENNAFSQQSPAVYYQEKGEEQLAASKYNEAVSSFSSCIKENKKQDACYAGRGTAYMGLNKKKEAQSDFKTALKLNPSNQLAIQGLADVSSGNVAPTVTTTPNPKTTSGSGSTGSQPTEPIIKIKTPAYDKVFSSESKLFYITKNKKRGLMNKVGKVVVEPIYDDITGSITDNAFAVRLNGKFGYIDAKGKNLTPLQYDEAYQFQDGLALVSVKDNENRRRIGYINVKGEQVVPFNYSAGGFFSEGLSAMEKVSTGSIESRYIYLDTKGKQAIKTVYVSAGNFHDGMAAVSNEQGEFGMINKNGDLVIPYKYKFIGDMKGGLVGVELNRKKGFINKTGAEVVPVIYDDATLFSDGFVSVTIKGKRGFVNATGKLVIPATYDYDYGFHSGTALVQKNNKWGLIDKKGAEQIPVIYETVYNLTGNHDLFMVKENGKYNMVDSKNRKITSTGFDEINMFEGEYAVVQDNKKKGLINKQGKIVVPLIYDVLTNVMDGLAYVSNANGSGLIEVL